MADKQQSRGHWGSRLGFILAAAGSAIGLGNLWKFPYITHENGGGAFVLVYLICILLVGVPIMVAELLVGKKSQTNPVGAFSFLKPEAPGWKIIGILGVFTGFVILSYYSVIAGWTLEYSIKAFTGKFSGMDMGSAGTMFGEFVSNPFKQLQWHSVFMIMTILIVLGGISKGIERWSKILMPALILIIVTLIFFSVRLEGAGEAFRFLFNPNFNELTPHGLLEALGHAFFTLSLGMGAMITYGSYLDKNISVVNCGITVAVLDTIIALMACMMMFPIIFTYKVEGLESISIIFTTIPTLLAKMPGGFILAPLFFILVFFAALTSAISLLEVVVSWGVDEMKWNRPLATLFLGGVTFLFGVPSALCNGGVSWLSKPFLPKGIDPVTGELIKLNYLDAWDYLASNWFLPIGGLLTAIFVGWAMKKEDMLNEFPADGHRYFFRIWIFSLKFIAPVLVVIVMLYKLELLNFLMR